MMGPFQGKTLPAKNTVFWPHFLDSLGVGIGSTNVHILNV